MSVQFEITQYNSNTKNRQQNRKETWSLTGNSDDFGIIEKQNKPIQTKELYPKHHSHAGRVYDPKGIGRSLISSEGGVGKQTGLYEVGDRIRKLTPTECERIMGFPDGWTDAGVSNTQRYKCLGNSVVVPVIEYIARRFQWIQLIVFQEKRT